MTDMTIDLAGLKADPRVSWAEDVIRFGDTDLNGHVNNAAFVVFCESGRVGYFADRIAPAPDRFFVLAHLDVDFRIELTYPGRVRTATWLTRIGTSSLGFAQALFADSGVVAASAKAACVAMNALTRRPLPFVGDVRDRLLADIRADTG